MDKIDEILTRATANIIPGKSELEKLLNSGKKLNVYLGIDPTSTKIHLGHTVGLRKLQQFAALGYNVTFVIGDFTALIGDTSDKDSERPSLSKEEIEENFKTYKKQAEKVLDFSKVKIRYNSEWLKKLSFEDIVKLTQHFSAGDFTSRELVRKRLNEGKKVGLHEFLYPVMQGYDSYFMDTDIQVGGTDQTFNMQAGRTLQSDLRNKESFVLTTPILEGPDGRKMSKSWGNAIWLDDKPNDIYAKVMAVEDNLIITYFTLVTNISLKEIDEIKKELEEGENPISAKKQLAYEIVSELHGEGSAREAQENFERTVQRNELPESIELHTFDKTELGIIDILIHLPYEFSTSEAKRLIEQGGISVNGKVIKNSNEVIKLNEDKLLKIGKRRVVKISSK